MTIMLSKHCFDCEGLRLFAQTTANRKWGFTTHHSYVSALFMVGRITPRSGMPWHRQTSSVTAMYQDKEWIQKYRELVKYQDVHGHCHVPRTCTLHPDLALWVRKQRDRYNKIRHSRPSLKKERRSRYSLTSTASNQLPHLSRKGTITRHQIEALGRLNFKWSTLDASWHYQYCQLVKYKEHHGHCLVSRRYAETSALFRWAERQRASFAKLKKQSERQQVGKIDVDKEQNKTVDVNVSLKATSLTLERIDLLNDIGFVWDILDMFWIENFDKFQKFVKEHGHGLVPQCYPPDQSLGNWAAKQRHHYLKYMPLSCSSQTSSSDLIPKKNRERIQLLQKEGFVFRVLHDRFQERVDALRAYKNRHGHVLVPWQDAENAVLSSFVSSVRAAYNSMQGRKRYRTRTTAGTNKYDNEVDGNELNVMDDDNTIDFQGPEKGSEGRTERYRLTSERLKALNELGFVWDPVEAVWRQRFHELCSFRKKHGHCLILYHGSPNDDQHDQLYSWSNRQRRDFKRLQSTFMTSRRANSGESFRICASDASPLSSSALTLLTERLRLLIENDFVWNLQEYQWHQMFNKLVQYRIEMNHWPKLVLKADQADQQNLVSCDQIQDVELINGFKGQEGNQQDLLLLSEWVNTQRRHLWSWENTDKKQNVKSGDHVVGGTEWRNNSRIEAFEEIGFNLFRNE